MICFFRCVDCTEATRTSTTIFTSHLDAMYHQYHRFIATGMRHLQIITNNSLRLLRPGAFRKKWRSGSTGNFPTELP